MSEFARRPWQLLTGTPTELAAKAERSRLNGELRATNLPHRKRAGLEASRSAQAALTRPLTRRRVIAASAAAVLAAGVGGYEARKHWQEPTYSGPIEAMHDLPPITEERLAAAMTELYLTQDPLLVHAAQGLEMLTSTQTTPDEFPSWLVSEKSSPLPIVIRNNDSMSTTHLNTPSDPDSPKLIYVSNDIVDQGWADLRLLKPMDVGISLGSLGIKDGEDSLGDALVLAKEYFSLMSVIQMHKEGAEWTRRTNQGEILNHDRSPVVDPNVLSRAGMTVVHGYTTDLNVGHQVTDGIGILFLCSSVNNLVNRGYLSPEIMDAFHLNIMDTFYQDPETKIRVDYLANEWINRGTLLPELPQASGYLFSEFLLTDDNPIMRASVGFFSDPGVREQYPYYSSTPSNS